LEGFVTPTTYRHTVTPESPDADLRKLVELEEHGVLTADQVRQAKERLVKSRQHVPTPPQPKPEDEGPADMPQPPQPAEAPTKSRYERFVDRLVDKTVEVIGGPDPGHIWSYDWCRFRKNSRCMYPIQLDDEATKEAGYAVWVPADRGYCPRKKWDDQKTCPIAEPGPHSGDPDARTDATVSWADGGQRLDGR
jgi:hypothetical protein